MPGPIYKQVVPSGQKRWVILTGDKPETTEQFCPEQLFQDGRVRNDQGSVASRTLDVYSGQAISPRGEGTEHNSDLPNSGQGVRTAAITVAGQVECIISGHTVSSSPLPSVAAGEDPVTQKIEVIQCTSDVKSESNREIVMGRYQLKNRLDIIPPAPDMVIKTDALTVG